MPQVQQTFTGNVQDLEAKLAKVQAEMLKLRETNARVSGATREHAATASQAFSGLTSAVQGYAAGWLSLATAIATASAGMREWKSYQKEVSEKGRDLAKTQTAGAIQAGLALRATEVDRWIKEQTTAGRALPEEARAALFGAAKGIPAATLAEKQSIAAEALKAAPLLGSAEATGEYAETLAAVKRAMPGKTTRQVADLLAYLRQKEPEAYGTIREEQFLRNVHQAISGGIPAEDIMAAMTGATSAGASPRAIHSLLQSITAERAAPRVTPGVAWTPQERIEAEFARMTPGEQWQRLLTDRGARGAILGPELAGALTRLTGQLPAERERMGKVAGLAEREWAAAAAAPAGITATDQHRIAVEGAARDARNRDKATAARVYGEVIEEQYREAGGPGPFGLRWLALQMARGEEWIARGVDEALGRSDLESHAESVRNIRGSAAEKEFRTRYWRERGQEPPPEPEAAAAKTDLDVAMAGRQDREVAAEQNKRLGELIVTLRGNATANKPAAAAAAQGE